jgi:cytidyltransferase-like protein
LSNRRKSLDPKVSSEGSDGEDNCDSDHPEFETAEMKMLHFANNEIKDNTENQNYKYKKRRVAIETKIPALAMNDQPVVADTRVDKVFTVGCFDLFHDGHVNLIMRMRQIGKKVIVGVHDSRSIYKLKNRVPVDSTEKRMLNVKKHADEVSVVFVFLNGTWQKLFYFSPTILNLHFCLMVSN